MPIESLIAEHARRDFPAEACGLVVRAPAGGLTTRPTRNAAEDPLANFLIPPEEQLAARLEGVLVGYYHSHPAASAEPSEADREAANEIGLPCWIYSVPDSVLGVYVPPGAETPLEGREFIPLVHDCVSLVWDYIRREKGISLPFLPRTAADYVNGTPIDWRPWLKQYGAQLVTIPEPGDMLAMSLYGSARVNHLGIYIGGGHFLHQNAEHPSGHEVWDGAWRRNTQFIIRLPDRRPRATPAPAPVQIETAREEATAL